MFWKFTTLNTSKIDTILEKEDTTLVEVLNEDDVLQECKAQNKNLIQFLCKPCNIDGLVTYITKEPDDSKAYRYSNIAHELLISDVPEIAEKIAEAKVLKQLFEFLESPLTHNSLLSSFVVKVFSFLICRKPEEVIEFFMLCPNTVSLFIEKLGTSAIKDILFEILTQIQNAEVHKIAREWLIQEQLIPNLMALFDTAIENDLQQSNATHLINDVLLRLRAQATAQGSEDEEHKESDELILLSEIESEDTITCLINHMFAEGKKSESSLLYGTAILKEIAHISPAPINSNEQSAKLCQERFLSVKKNFSKAVLPKLELFHNLLIEPPVQAQIKTSIGYIEQPVGSVRIEVCDLFNAILQLNDLDLNKQFISLGTIRLLMEMISKYAWNTILHCKIYACLSTIFYLSTCVDGDTSESSHSLLEPLFSECHIVQWLLNVWEDEPRDTGVLTRPGYMGHLTLIANTIVQLAEGKQDTQTNGKGDVTLPGNSKDENEIKYSPEAASIVKKMIGQLPKEVLDSWTEFVSTSLCSVNKQHEWSSNAIPRQSVSTEGDVEMDLRNLPLDEELGIAGLGMDSFPDDETEKKDKSLGFSSFDASPFGMHYALYAAASHLSSDKSSSSTEDSNASASAEVKDINVNIEVAAPKLDNDDHWVEKELQFAPSAMETGPSEKGAQPSNELSSSSSSEGDSEDEERTTRDQAATKQESNIKDMFAQDLDNPDDDDTFMMDVDDNFQGKVISAVDDGPVAMDTSNPWDSSSSGNQSKDGDSSQTAWADFGAAKFEEKGEKGEDTENWASFPAESKEKGDMSREKPTDTDISCDDNKCPETESNLTSTPESAASNTTEEIAENNLLDASSRDKVETSKVSCQESDNHNDSK